MSEQTVAVTYGGQAVIEGVMMRGPRHFSVACRRASGEIALTSELVPPVLRPRWQNWPFLRGAFALVDALALGTKALFWAAKIAESDLAGAERRPSRVTDVALGGTMVVSLFLALGLTVVLPNLALEAAKAVGVHGKTALAVWDGVVRAGIFFGYVALVGRWEHVRRVFQYHGAEHKAINALEAGAPLTVAGARAQSRFHPRCGTSFVVIVLLLSNLAFAPFREQPLWVRLLIDLALTPPVAGVAFELLRLAGRYRRNPVAAVLSKPGMWTQGLTTREPDDAQLEVALASLQAVIDAEHREREGRPAA